MVELRSDWNDLGSWESVWEHFAKDQNGNVTKGDVLTFQTSDSFAYSNDRPIV